MGQDLYACVDEWLGERLSTKSLSKVARRNESDWRDLLLRYREQRELDPRWGAIVGADVPSRPGELRLRMARPEGFGSPLEESHSLRRSLLIAHGALLDSRLMGSVSAGNYRYAERELETMAMLRPLAEMDAFSWVESPQLFVHWMDDARGWLRLGEGPLIAASIPSIFETGVHYRAGTTPAEMAEKLKWLTQQPEAGWYSELVSGLRVFGCSGASLLFEHPMQRLALPVWAEVAANHWLLNGADPNSPHDRREINAVRRIFRLMPGMLNTCTMEEPEVRSVLRLDIPDSQLTKFSDIVELRRSSELFSTWRLQLREGLRAADEVVVQAPEEWDVAAKRVLVEHLEPHAQRLKSEAARGGLSSTLQGVTIGFGVSLLGVSASTAAGGALAPSAAAAAATTVASGAAAFAKDRANRAQIPAQLAHFAAFLPPEHQ